MSSGDSSDRPRIQKRSEALSDAILKSAGPREIIHDTIVPQLRAKCGRGVKRSISFLVDYWSRPESRSRTFTIGKWAPEMSGRRAGVSVPDARRKAAEVVSLAKLGQDPHQDRMAARRGAVERRSGPTVRELCKIALRRLGPGLRPKTLEQYEGTLRLHVIPEMGDRPAARVTRRDVRMLLDRIARSHPTTAVRTLGALRRAYSVGLDLEIVQASPCAGLRSPAKLEPRGRVYSSEEVAAIWRGLVNLEMGAATAPPGVVSAAQLRAHARVYQRRIPPERSKSRREHVLPLAPMAEALLRRALAEAGGGWLFPDRDPDPNRDRSHVRPATKIGPVVRGACGVSDLRLHDLRRTCSDVMLHQLEAPPFVVEVGVLGHRAPGLLGVYAPGHGLAATRAAFEAWERYLATQWSHLQMQGTSDEIES